MRYVNAFSLGAALALVSAGSVAAAQDDGRSAAEDGTPIVSELTCANGGTPRKVPVGPYDAVSGPVRFSNGRLMADYPHRHFKPHRKLGYFKLKSLLLVDAGARVRIEVAPVNRGHAWLSYKRAKHPADVLDIACSHPKPKVWIGVVIVDGAQCLRLRVIHRDTTSILRIPFGRDTCRRA